MGVPTAGASSSIALGAASLAAASAMTCRSSLVLFPEAYSSSMGVSCSPAISFETGCGFRGETEETSSGTGLAAGAGAGAGAGCGVCDSGSTPGAWAGTWSRRS